MRKIAMAACIALAAAAAPAHANEGRVEARGGITWANGVEEGIAGVAGGYDFDLGTGAFAGVELSADKILTSNTRVTVGGNVRLGGKLEGGTKLYAIGGYQTKPCQFCEESWSAGAGAQVPFGESLYGKVEYRHFFVGKGIPDFNAAIVGIGVRF